MILPLILAAAGGAYAADQAGDAADANQRGIDAAGLASERGAREAIAYSEAPLDYVEGANSPYLTSGLGAQANINRMLGIQSSAGDTRNYAAKIAQHKRKIDAIEKRIEKVKAALALPKSEREAAARKLGIANPSRDGGKYSLSNMLDNLSSKKEENRMRITSAQRALHAQTQQREAMDTAEAGASGVQQITPFEFSGEDIFTDPSYQFRLDQGLEALDRRFASRGGLGSGNRMVGISDFAQQSASQEYQSAFDRAHTQWRSQFDVLNANLGILGLGRSATESNINAVLGQGQVGAGILANQGSNQANMAMAGGANQAAGIMGQNSAVQGFLGQMGYIGGREGWFDGDDSTPDTTMPDIEMDYTGP